MSLWLEKIKRIAVKNSPGFYGLIVELMIVKINAKIPTVAIVNGEVWINPYFVSKLSNEQVGAIFVHEVKHILLHNFSERREVITDGRSIQMVRKDQ